MPRTRLTANDRDRLLAFARETIECPEEKSELDRAYERALPHVRVAIERVFPAFEMEICKKYGAVHKREFFDLSFGRSDVSRRFYLRSEHARLGPVIAFHNPDIICRSGKREINDYFEALRAHNKKREAKLSDYADLIAAARTLEDIVAVWPDVGRLRLSGHSKTAAPLIIDPAVVDRIKADCEARAASDVSKAAPKKRPIKRRGRRAAKR